MAYNVFLLASTAIGPRDHHAIFVESHISGMYTGHIYQVTGNVQQGMSFEEKETCRPEEKPEFASKTLLGIVTVEEYPRLLEICGTIAPPKKQYQLNRRLYPHEPLRRCQEWTKEAVTALRDAGILQNTEEAAVPLGKPEDTQT